MNRGREMIGVYYLRDFLFECFKFYKMFSVELIQEYFSFFDLQGYLLGNPRTSYDVERNYAIPFAHGMGLISDELYVVKL